MGALVGAMLALSSLAGPASSPQSSAPSAPSAPGDAAAEPSAGPSGRAAATSGGRRFWVKDEHRYASPWYAGNRRKMIGFGCTRAPYYSPHPDCVRKRGFHHGLDLAMPCGTRLSAGFRGRIVNPRSKGAPGPAYGHKAFRIRNHRKDVDVVVGHARRVYVDPGDRVRKGQLIARASDAGAPDGCHLHFEVRPIRGGYRSAVRPHDYLELRR